MQATPECFAHLTQMLQPLAGGRICAVLEVTASSLQGVLLRRAELSLGPTEPFTVPLPFPRVATTWSLWHNPFA